MPQLRVGGAFDASAVAFDQATSADCLKLLVVFTLLWSLTALVGAAPALDSIG